MTHQQKPRIDDILEAHRLLGLVINAAANGRAAVDGFTLRDNAFSYNTGIGSVEVVVTTRNFMDARREALAKAAAAEKVEIRATDVGAAAVNWLNPGP
jgi:hypothetical protein